MTTLRRPARQVKSRRPFGEGILTRPRRIVTDADRAWAAAELNRDARDYEVVFPAPKPISGGAPDDAEWDRLADLAAFVDRYTRGLD